MVTLEGNLTLKQVVEQGFEEIRQGFLEQLKKTIEGLLKAERDRRVAALRNRGRRFIAGGTRCASAGRHCGERCRGVRVPRLRSPHAEAGLLEKYQRHALGDVLFALTVGGLSQCKVVLWVQRFLGGSLSVATIGAVLRQAREEVEKRRQEPLRVGEYVALVVDGVYIHYRRRAQQPGREGVLLVAGGVPMVAFGCWTGRRLPVKVAQPMRGCSRACGSAAWSGWI